MSHIQADDSLRLLLDSQKKTSALGRFARRFFTVQNVLLAVGWLAWLALLLYVQAQTKDLAPFDPFEILKVGHFSLKMLTSCMCALLLHPARSQLYCAFCIVPAGIVMFTTSRSTIHMYCACIDPTWSNGERGEEGLQAAIADLSP